MKVLSTGGAGFTASHLTDRLLADGHDVRALDNLDRQVHPGGERPDYLDAPKYCAEQARPRQRPRRRGRPGSPRAGRAA